MTVTLDALYFLLLIEFALIMFIVSVYLFIKNRKHKKLHEKTTKELFLAREAIKDMEQAAGADIQQTAEHFQQAEAQEIIEQQKTDATEIDQPPAESLIEDDIADEDTLKGKVRKMQKIINSQKGKILELICYKDIFEGAEKKLLPLSERFKELQEKFVKLLEQSPDNADIRESLKLLETNNKEIESCMDILNKENNNLSRKFELWEEELKKITEEAEHGEYEKDMQDKIAQEKEEMLLKIKEFEDKLKEKDNQLLGLQKQYEDIEKEYMILYRQQQQQQQQQQR